jgi:hypothetical protein
VDEWIKEMWYIQDGILVSPKKEGNSVIGDHIDETGQCYVESISQTQKVTYCVISLTCGV